jgi:Cu/Ag efflux protein CusF
MMKARIVATLGALTLLLAAGCATTLDKPPAQDKPAAATQQPAHLEIRDKITATATVQAVDLEKREVVLKGKSGKLHTIKVGEEVRNLPQVKVGDRVVLTYYEALAVTLEKNATGGIATRKDTVTVDRAELGQKPAGTVRKDVEIVANVTAVNQKTRRVTLQGAQDAVTLKVPDDIDISKLKVGDQVSANYVQELAISVQPAATKKK